MMTPENLERLKSIVKDLSDMQANVNKILGTSGTTQRKLTVVDAAENRALFEDADKGRLILYRDSDSMKLRISDIYWNGEQWRIRLENKKFVIANESDLLVIEDISNAE